MMFNKKRTLLFAIGILLVAVAAVLLSWYSSDGLTRLNLMVVSWGRASYALSEQQPEVIANFVAMAAAIFSFLSAAASWKQVLQVSEERQATLRPHVTTGFEHDERGLIEFVVTSDGGSPAMNIIIEFEPDHSPLCFNGKSFENNTFIRSAIPCAPPGWCHRQLVNSGIALLKDGSPTSFKWEVTYESGAGQKFKDIVDHDIEYMRGYAFSPDSLSGSVKDIANSLKKISALIELASKKDGSS